MGKSSKEMSCYNCGGKMVRTVISETHTYKRQSVTFDQPCWQCQNCSEIIFNSEDAGISEEMYFGLRSTVNHLLTPEQIQEIRKKLRISQKEAGLLLDESDRSFQRYESGKETISQPMNNLLFILQNHPELLNELRNR